ncbi:MAG: hypothetical protein JXA81_01340 [Sedimentisphaerales bacterium]|nr:hypothetical protein [Sedimentisphaerales bacterium]
MAGIFTTNDLLTLVGSNKSDGMGITSAGRGVVVRPGIIRRAPAMGGAGSPTAWMISVGDVRRS